MLRRVVAGNAVVVAVGFVLAAARWEPRMIMTAVPLSIGAVVLAVTVLSGRSQGDRRRRRLPYRMFMVTQYSTHAVLLVGFLI
jgi:hypothetical protein